MRQVVYSFAILRAAVSEAEDRLNEKGKPEQNDTYQHPARNTRYRDPDYRVRRPMQYRISCSRVIYWR